LTWKNIPVSKIALLGWSKEIKSDKKQLIKNKRNFTNALK